MGGSTTISTSETRIEALKLQSSAFGIPVALVWGRTRLAGNLTGYWDFKAVAHTTTQSQGGKGGGGVKQQNTTYTYSACVQMGLCHGQIVDVPQVWKGKTVYATDAKGSALSKLGLTLFNGAAAQSPWSYLSTKHPDQALSYRGVAYVAGIDYALDASATVENHSFEVVGARANAVAAYPDANPWAIVYDLLTDRSYGAGFPISSLADLSDYAAYCAASSLLLSPALTEARACAEILADICRLTNSAPVWSGGVLKIIPYGDTQITGNGTTWTPNTTPIYDLNDDDFLADPGEEPVKLTRKPSADAYNHIKIEFFDRANAYNKTIVEAKDQANIEAFGLRTKDTISATWICDAGIARTVAQLVLQRVLYVRNTYEFRCSWAKALLEPMDLVTLTDSGLGLSKTVVRIVSVEEDEQGTLTFTAEEWTGGAAHAAMYPTEPSAGFAHNYGAAPGDAFAPVMFEAPVELTQTGLEVYLATSGTGAYWGGCTVWVSTDGVNYKQASVLYGGSRYGLGGPISGGVFPIILSGQGGQMLSGTAADAAQAGPTLMWSDGEYFSYTTATLVAANSYNLSGLVRGQYGSPQAAMSSTKAAVRVDQAIGKSGPLDLSWIGKTIYFKLTSFNVFGAAEQSLADVAAYPYTITGAMAKLPPKDPTSVTAVVEPFGIRTKWAKNPEPDVTGYEVAQGATYGAAVVLEPKGGTSYLWAVQTAGTYTIWVTAIDAFGNRSAPTSATVTISPPAVSGLTGGVSGNAVQLSWAGAPGSFSLAGFEVRYGASWAAGTSLGLFTASKFNQVAQFGGSRTYWVAAYDVAGNYGAAQSVTVVATVPGPVTSQRAEVVDNNALLYWSPPATGTLPIDRYEVRKGASWAAGTQIGSNGNSTFCAVFEQSSGTYTYWVAAVDTAGNYGAQTAITATINQPPDYILRSNIDSALGGTLSNLYWESGAIYGPVPAETFGAHFTNRSWSTPQNQVDAGYPKYYQPSTTAGYYEETIDYGAVLPATTITATLAWQVVDGAVSITPTISYKAAAGDAWTNAAAGSSSVLAAGFRYVKVRYDFAAAAGANLIRITGLNVKLSIKLKTDSGAGNANAGDAGGTVVSFNVAFIDADTPLVQPGGTTPVIPVVDFTDVPNPTTFKVLLFDRNGNRVSGPFSWTARGY